MIFQHAGLLNNMGIRAAVVSKEAYPDWFEHNVPFYRVKTWKEALDKADFFIATYYGVLLDLWKFRSIRSRIIHFSQGIETEYEEAKPFLSEIISAYELPCPVWTISENLAGKLRARFPGKHVYVVGQPLDIANFYPPEAPPTETPIQVILPGPLEISIKGIRFGLEALKALKKECPFVKTIRLSQADTSREEERIFRADEYHAALPPQEVGKLLRKGHVLFSPSLEGEGFGLPPLEAMACGTATCLSAISSYLSWDSPRDYALFFEPMNLDEAVSRLVQLATDAELRSFLGKRGLEVAKKFHPEQVGRRIVNFLEHYPKTGGE